MLCFVPINSVILHLLCVWIIYSLIKGITPKILMLCFVLINSLFGKFSVFGSCFRTLAVILVSDFCSKQNKAKPFNILF